MTKLNKKVSFNVFISQIIPHYLLSGDKIEYAFVKSLRNDVLVFMHLLGFSDNSNS